MNLRFIELQRSRDMRTDVDLAEPSQVRAILGRMREMRPPVMCEFVGANGYTLTVGVDDAFGVVQHASTQGLPQGQRA